MSIALTKPLVVPEYTNALVRLYVSHPVTSATLHLAAGTRSVLVRSSSLRKRGTYTIEWRAVDAMANKGNVVRKSLKVKR